MLTARKRLKVLLKKWKLPLIPEAVKVGQWDKILEPMIILPNKKTMRKLQRSGHCWEIKNTFIYYCLIIISQLANYCQYLPPLIRDDRIILIVDGHPSRFSFTTCLILYLFNIDLVLLPPHTFYRHSMRVWQHH